MCFGVAHEPPLSQVHTHSTLTRIHTDTQSPFTFWPFSRWRIDFLDETTTGIIRNCCAPSVFFDNTTTTELIRMPFLCHAKSGDYENVTVSGVFSCFDITLHSTSENSGCGDGDVNGDGGGCLSSAYKKYC